MFRTILIVALTAAGSGIPVNKLLNQGYNEMYNLQFEQAHQTFKHFKELHPGDPMASVSDAAAYLFQEFDRLHVLRSELFLNDAKYISGTPLKPDPQIRKAFEADLQQTKSECQETLTKSPDDRRALLADVLRVALQADYEALIAHQNMQALSDIERAQKEADKLLAVCKDCYDADLAIGVENYLLSQKSAPMRWFLDLTGAQTDKRTGIDKLRIVAEKGTYLRPYAKVLLAIAEIRDGKKDQARRLLTELANDFPHNNIFKQELAKL
jgi:tetratricopeptide (TPR) repeat protein